MDVGRVFDDLGVSAVVGTKLMERFNLNPWDIEDPRVFQKLHVVIDYLKRFNEDTQSWIISKVASKVNEDRLNVMYEYVDLLKRQERLDEEKKQYEEELTKTEEGSESFVELGDKLAQNTEMLGRIMEEISIYEK